MGWNNSEGIWKNFKGRVKEKWGKLAGNKIEVKKARNDQWEKELREKNGTAEVDRQILELQRLEPRA